MPYIAEDGKIYYSVNELCKFLNLSRAWLIELVKRWNIKCLEVPRGGRGRFMFFIPEEDAKRIARAYDTEL